jgi:hypothetical protein
MESILSDIYYDTAAGYCGVKHLFQNARKKIPNLKLSDVKKWLASQPTYSVHKYARRTYPRNKVIVSGIDEQWQMDLVDLTSLVKFNEGYKFLLTCIDIFSKFS